MPRPSDAFGHMVRDHFRSGDAVEVIERDDGYIDTTAGAEAYFAPHDVWPPTKQAAIALVRGRVLDVGCGAGRVCLHLQERGLDVVGIDISPLAVETCRERGVRDACVLSITRVSRSLGIFDTVVMMGNNFGLFGNRQRARWLLRRLAGMTTADARIIAETMDPYMSDNPDHAGYHDCNRRRGRMGGQIRLRVRYKSHVGAWFDYLFVSKAEMSEILDGTGWRVAQFLESGGPGYIAVIEKAAT
ncbi:methyltransferase type 11 [Candidatus Poribacteria bacterium]|nr:methyltransferase type 11 [Candidatus Poribacteria bacterium]